MTTADERVELEYMLRPSTWPKTERKDLLVHDPIWGLIRVHGHEAAILDLPLLQRLRTCRQTPMAEFGFPAATHSVFSHTLGVLHVAGEILDSLSKNSGVRISAHDRSLVRVAALLHDCARPVLGAIGAQALGLRDEGLTAAAVVRSDAFANVWQTVAGSDDAVGSITVEEIALLLDGGIDSDRRYLADAVFGPLGADRLDFLCRDSRMAGVNLGFDPQEIIASLRVARVDGLRREHLSARGAAQVLAVSSAAFPSIERLAHSWVGTWRDIYMHPDVRRARALLVHALRETLCEDPAGRTRIALASDAEFLSGRFAHSPSAARLFEMLNSGVLPRELVRIDLTTNSERSRLLGISSDEFASAWLHDAIDRVSADPRVVYRESELLVDMPRQISLRMLFEIPVTSPDGSVYGLEDLSPIADLAVRATRSAMYVAVYTISDETDLDEVIADSLRGVLDDALAADAV